MKKKEKEALIDKIKDTIDIHSNIALELDVSEDINERVYSDRDLLNATVIFHHILGNISIAHHIDKGLTIKQITTLAEELGKSLRQTILLHTGLDPRDLVEAL